MRTYEKIETVFARDMEGIVCRPALELHDRCGNRLIVKIKRNDMVEL